MPPGQRELSITGPDEDWLDKPSVIALLKLTGEEQLASLIEQGLFPPPILQPLHKARPLWRSLDIACYWWNLSRGCVALPEAERKFGSVARARRRNGAARGKQSLRQEKMGGP